MRVKIILVFAILLCTLTVHAQSVPAQTAEEKRAEMREKIGLDLSVPDFDTKEIDVKVMGERLTGILNYLMESYQQGVYDRKLCQIASEQNEALENVYFQIKKMRFLSASRICQLAS